ncbi:MAG TPA: hypothetical protein H9687_08245 [Firmicutes bacterium]|nr:hypothetical protein [Bacillota bacterium]
MIQALSLGQLFGLKEEKKIYDKSQISFQNSRRKRNQSLPSEHGLLGRPEDAIKNLLASKRYKKAKIPSYRRYYPEDRTMGPSCPKK